MKQKIVGYGEVLMRLTPFEYGDLIERSENLTVDFAGAEANIIADLALLGHDTSFVTGFPENPLGRSAVRSLRSFGIGTSSVYWNDDRIGIYFIEHGTSIRGSRVTYDRSHSAVTKVRIDEKTWESIFDQASYFVLTGITPALSQICRDNIRTALSVAKKLEVKVMFDLNYRRTLWSKDEAKSSFESILPYVDLLIANTGSAFDVFDIETDDIQDHDSLATATEQATNGLENLGDFEYIAMTMRLQKSASDNLLSGFVRHKGKSYYSSVFPTEIIDRMGGGDAFAASVLHGVIKEWGIEKTVNFAAAAFAATQTIQGDINYVTEEELLKLADGNIRGYVKR